jgi:hypothetical protein
MVDKPRPIAADDLFTKCYGVARCGARIFPNERCSLQYLMDCKWLTYFFSNREDPRKNLSLWHPSRVRSAIR